MEQKILENIIKTALEQKVSSKEEIIKIERQFCDEKIISSLLFIF